MQIDQIGVMYIAVQKPMKGFTASRSTGIDLPDMHERYLSRNVNIGEKVCGRSAKDQIASYSIINS